MANSRLAVVLGVTNTFLQGLGGIGEDLLAERTPHDVTSEGKGKPPGVLGPPSAEVCAEKESFLLIGELAFVDNQACIDMAC